MKLLAVVFVVILVAQLTVATVKFSLNDLIQAYEEQQNIENNKIEVATEALYIPTTLKMCLNSTCDAVCKALGYSHGVCINASTCRCSN